MPERDNFPKHYFEGNPYEDMSPEEVYEKIRWGNEPQETFDIEAPEPLATIGDLAQLCTSRGNVKFSEREAPFLALGTYTNRLYIVPKIGNEPVDVPYGPYEYVCQLWRTDYYSDKGGDIAYYYHNHESPYPHLYINKDTGVCILIPARCKDGTKSYAVGDEGVIG